MTLVFKNCCCCINLRTGSLIIGYMNLIGLISLFFSLVVSIGYYFRSWITGTLVVLDLILITIHLIFTLMLLYSIHRNVHKYIPKYISYNTAILILNIILFVANCFMYHISTSDIFTEVISFLITIYFLLVIRSYYYEVKLTNTTNSHPTAVYNPPAPIHNQPPTQTVYLAPGSVTSSGIFVMPSGYPHPGTQTVNVTYPIQGGYPSQGQYPTQGAYPAQGAYPNLPPYSTTGSYQTPAAYPGPDRISTRVAPSAPTETEKTGLY